MSLIKLPKAKEYLEVEGDLSLIEFCRILKFGYGYEFNVDDFEFDSDDDKEKVIEIFNNPEILNDNAEIDICDFTIELSLPETDRFFAANANDVLYAKSVLYAYGSSMTKENTQVRLDNLDNHELKDLFNKCIENVSDKEFGSFLYSFSLLCQDHKHSGEPIEKCVFYKHVKYYAK